MNGVSVPRPVVSVLAQSQGRAPTQLHPVADILVVDIRQSWNNVPLFHVIMSGLPRFTFICRLQCTSCLS